MWYININKHIIAANAKHGTRDPAVRFQRGKTGKQTYCYRLKITEGEVLYSPDKPILKCGARLVIQTPHQPEVME